MELHKNQADMLCYMYLHIYVLNIPNDKAKQLLFTWHELVIDCPEFLKEEMGN